MAVRLQGLKARWFQSFRSSGVLEGDALPDSAPFETPSEPQAASREPDNRKAVLWQTAHFVAAIFALIAAQYLFSQRDPVFVRFTFAEALSNTFHFYLPNFDNVLFAVALLIFSGILLARVLKPPTVKPATPSHSFSLSRIPMLHRLLIVIAGITFLVQIQLLRNADSSLVPVGMWVFVLLISAGVLFSYDKRAGRSLRLGIDRFDLFLIFLVLAAGLFVGTYQLNQTPDNVIGDEGKFLERALMISQGEEQASFFDLGVYSYPLASSFYQGWLFQLLGASFWTWRFTSVLAGVLAVIPTYLLAREMFDRRVALISCVALITLPYFLAFSRTGYNNSQSILPVALSVYLLYAGWKRGSVFYVGLSGITAGLGFYTYTAGRLGVVIGVAFLVYLTLSPLLALRSPEMRQQAKERVGWLGILLIVFGVCAFVALLPSIVLPDTLYPHLLRAKTLESLFPNALYAGDFYPQGELFRDYPPIEIDGHTFFYRPDIYAELFVRGAVRSFLALHGTLGLESPHYIVAAMPGPLGVGFYFAGFVLALRFLKRREFVLLLGWLFGGLLLLSMINTYPPRFAHTLPVIPSIALLIAVGVAACADFIGALWQRYRRPLALVVVAGSLAAIVASSLYNYFVEMPKTYKPNFENIMAFSVMNATDPVRFIYISPDPNKAGFVPALLPMVVPSVSFQTILLEDLSTSVLDPTAKYTFFFHQENQEQVSDFLNNHFDTKIEPQPYTDSQGQIIALSWSND